MKPLPSVGALAVAVVLAACGCSVKPTATGTDSDPNRVPVVFSGGHDTDPVDMGRPVILIASALGVTPDVFRKAFSLVHPAPAFSAPGTQQVRENKAALMRALGP